MNKRTIIALTAACMILLAGAAYAEGSDGPSDLTSPALDFPDAAGAFGSFMLGGGLSWQHWYGPLGIAVTAGGMAYPNSSYYGYDVVETTASDFTVWNYNVQVDLLYRLYSSNFWKWLSGDLYAFVTLAHMGSVTAEWVDEDGDYDTTDDAYYVPTPYVPVFAVGVGIGYEIILFRHFSLPLQFSYTLKYPLYVDFNFASGLRYRF
jgi:hypothetical protein